MSTEEQLDATCRRLRDSREEILQLVHALKGDGPRDPAAFPRSRIMRALTGERGRRVLGNAAIALAMSRPKTAWRLAAFAPLLRPVIVRFVVERLLRNRLLRNRRPVQPSHTELRADDHVRKFA
jgi:hypothetical protein